MIALKPNKHLPLTGGFLKCTVKFKGILFYNHSYITWQYDKTHTHLPLLNLPEEEDISVCHFQEIKYFTKLF